MSSTMRVEPVPPSPRCEATWRKRRVDGKPDRDKWVRCREDAAFKVAYDSTTKLLCKEHVKAKLDDWIFLRRSFSMIWE